MQRGGDWSVYWGFLPREIPLFTSEIEKILTEDMVYLVEAHSGLSIDVGWFPAGDPEGSFVCKYFEDGFIETPLEELHTRDLNKVRQFILEHVFNFRDGID